jgi:hypothetical protein
MINRKTKSPSAIKLPDFVNIHNLHNIKAARMQIASGLTDLFFVTMSIKLPRKPVVFVKDNFTLLLR